MKTLINVIMSLYISTIVSSYGLENFNGKLSKLKKKYKQNKDKITKTYKEVDGGYKETKEDIDNIKDKSKKINEKVNKKNNKEENSFKNNIISNNQEEDIENSLLNDINEDDNDDYDNNIEEILNNDNNISNKKYQKIIISSENITKPVKELTTEEIANRRFFILIALQIFLIITSILISIFYLKKRKHIRSLKVILLLLNITIYLINGILIFISNDFLHYHKIILLKDTLIILSTLFVGFFIGKSTYNIIIETTDLP